MNLLRFLLGALVTAITTFFYAAWARSESEAQIDKMQLDAYNTPGAQAPVPPHVFATGMTVLTGLWFVLARILRMPTMQRALAVLLGVAGGVAALFVFSTDEG